MKVLLDTHVFLWSIMDPEKLSPKALGLLKNQETEVFVSSVVSWEIAIKAKLERITLPESPSKFIPKQIKKGQFHSLSIEHTHALFVHDLPLHHHDPFDRLLIAQAKTEKIPILTKDPLFQKYDVKVIWS